MREDIVKLLGGVCVRCGFHDKRALQIDHVLGGGGKERSELKPFKFSVKVQQAAERKTGEYQLLCANCNWIKRFENGE